ncbi:MAG: hypothetical protein IT458_09520 [Planctomycetes bacterium]|nr:hypothetical protein [Planctomycetota bacterium]
MVRLGLYLHPFDLPGLASAGGMGFLRELGYTDLSLAVAYHAGRWLVPRRGGGMVRFLEDGTVHFRTRGAYGALAPRPSALVPASGPDPLAEFLAQAGAAGITPAAWTVLFHNSRLGRAHPGETVRNAFGDAYTYGLCPMRPAVRAYGEALCAELAGRPGLAVLELEAAGAFGHKHSSHHDKSSFTPEAPADFLLSYCFCDTCRGRLAAAGMDPEALAAAVRGILEERFVDADAMADASLAWDRLDVVLGRERVQRMIALRAEGLCATLDGLARAAGGPARVLLHHAGDPCSTGSSLGIATAALRGRVAARVVTHYGDGPERIAAAWQGEPQDAVPTWLAIWPRAPHFRSDGDLRRVAALARSRGCAGIRIYHLGLLPMATVARAARVLCEALRG